MMERLTERELNSVNNVSYCKCFFKGCNGQCATCDLQYEADMKLKEYEDLEEQGLLLKLPCKVGDTVYLINHYTTSWRKKPFKCYIDEFTIADNRCYAVLNANEPFYAMHRFRAVNINTFGETVFLTKEEAEAKLKELENE